MQTNQARVSFITFKQWLSMGLFARALDTSVHDEVSTHSESAS